MLPSVAQSLRQPGRSASSVRIPEMGLDVPADVRILVWDSSAEARYMVLPQRPPGTEGWSAAELVPLVTRDSMIGVANALDVADAGR